jgi:hypothetical protein
VCVCAEERRAGRERGVEGRCGGVYGAAAGLMIEGGEKGRRMDGTAADGRFRERLAIQFGAKNNRHRDLKYHPGAGISRFNDVQRQ